MMYKYSNLVLLALVATVAATTDRYTPTRIKYDELVMGAKDDEIVIDMNEKFWWTLREVGLISITDIPNFNKGKMMEAMENCIHTRQEISPPEFIMDGGTRRFTVGTQTYAGNVLDLYMALPDTKENICQDFRNESNGFRSTVQTVTDALATRLGLYSSNANILINNQAEDLTIVDTIRKGNHLEHFHTYYTNENPTNENDKTIDWHTDQGLMLLFTPGQQDGKSTEGFYIQLKDGSSVEVDFDTAKDDLVIMLGDGVDAYFNNKLFDKDGPSKELRSVPHALKLEPSSGTSTAASSSPRIWYGRMILPPNNAIVPASLEVMDVDPTAIPYTFEDQRKGYVPDNDGTAPYMGCSNPDHVARQLEGRSLKIHRGPGGNIKDMKPFSININPCAEEPYGEGYVFCWQRCMDYNNTQYKESCASPDGCNEFYNGNPNDITPEKCEGVGQEAMCMDDTNHVWIPGLHDHGYYLQCGRPDTVIQATYYPTNSPTGAPVPTNAPVPTMAPKKGKKVKHGKAYNKVNKSKYKKDDPKPGDNLTLPNEGETLTLPNEEGTITNVGGTQWWCPDGCTYYFFGCNTLGNPPRCSQCHQQPPPSYGHQVKVDCGTCCT